MTTDARVDVYIEKAAGFAQPLLRALRAQAREICPQAEEAIKWGMPALTYRGKLLCGFGAFKAHVAFYVHGPSGQGDAEGMGNFGRMTSPADLPSKQDMATLLAARMQDVDAGPKAVSPRKPARPVPDIPADFARALKASGAAADTFHGFAPSHRREYIAWILEAKRDETRAKRIAQAVEWLAEGKPRNWKYTNK
ncbi:MAG: YdeI/OmpD-associated family protein [Hyphomonas sp.]|uniref:YdeI/OmpD-associated family protein n=1 Tax=Hyphomonas sp. TaxID=87 RepID=UPI00352951F1